MNKHLVSLAILLSCLTTKAQQDLKLWYQKPASNWNEALPVGNGRLGAMVFGGIEEELLQLNEESLWSGGPVNTNPNPLAPEFLPQIRKALFEQDYKTAEELAKKLQGPFTESYEPLGDVRIKYDFPVGSKPEGYTRDLNISDATATTQFTINGVTYKREVFVTAPDQVIVVRLTASQKGALNGTVTASSPLYHNKVNNGKDEIGVNGKAPSHTDPSYLQTMEIPVVYNDRAGCRGMRFTFSVKAKSADGTLTTDENGLHIRGGSDVTIFVSAATSFNGFDKCPDKDGKDEKQIASQYMEKAYVKSFDAMKKAHIEDFQKYFNRVSLELPVSEINVPTDQRLQHYAEGAKDHGLEVLYFQYGRYLLISSSRPGGIPANLQGIWNHHVRPPWSSNFTTNINAEMNYWMVESANLSELHEPLLELIRKVSRTGTETAKNFYNASGWTLHHNTDIWATSNPMSGSPSWANWPLGGAWVSQHLWEHYQFTGDKKYLADFAFPLMKGAAQFCLDWLVENKDGVLVTAPSTSPENIFITDKGHKGAVSIATTMDMSLIWDLFTNTIQASQQLNIDEEFRKTLIEKRQKLYPLLIGKKGNLQEWYLDWEDEDPYHRHVSHLFGLFPGRQISPLRTPVFANGARRSLELRGDGGTGWSKGWKINLWARLHDGNHAYKLIREQLKLTGVEGTNYANGGGTYPNLLDAHPPFQIDGNFGGTSGITEMLLQSHDEVLHLLPALPDEWHSGKITGLKARGGLTVDITWSKKNITEVRIHSSLGNTVRIMSPSKLKSKGLVKATGPNSNPFYQPVDSGTGKSQPASPGAANVYDLKTEAGKIYILQGS
jgi:alpha-L-fucosidase 2